MSQPPYPPSTSGPQPGGGSYPPPANQGFGGPPPANQGFGSAPPADQGFGYAPPPPPPKKRSTGKIVALVVGVVVLLCAGGIGTAVFVSRDKVKDVVAATKIKVVEPDTLGNRPKASDPDMDTALQGGLAQMKAQADVTGTAGAIYGDPKKLDILMLMAASSIGGSAQDRYNGVVQGMGTSFGATSLKDVDPGPLGGIAKCGDGKISEVPLGICLWADSGSFAMLVLFNKKGADLQKDFISYRSQIEQKS
jgi:hypothetical protein